LDQAVRRLTFRHEVFVSIGCCTATHDALAYGSIGDRSGAIARLNQVPSPSERSGIAIAAAQVTTHGAHQFAVACDGYVASTNPLLA
jgi:hypothetical protein